MSEKKSEVKLDEVFKGKKKFVAWIPAHNGPNIVSFNAMNWAGVPDSMRKFYQLEFPDEPTEESDDGLHKEYDDLQVWDANPKGIQLLADALRGFFEQDEDDSSKVEQEMKRWWDRKLGPIPPKRSALQSSPSNDFDRPYEGDETTDPQHKK